MAGLLPLAISRAQVMPRSADGLTLAGPRWLRLVPLLHGWPLGRAVVAAASRDRRGARPAPRPTYPA